MGNSCKGSSNQKSVTIPSRIIQIQTNPKQLKTTFINFSSNKNELSSLPQINSRAPPSEAQATGEPEEEIKVSAVYHPITFKYDLRELGIGEYYLEKEFIELKNIGIKTKQKEQEKSSVKWDRIVVHLRVKFPPNSNDRALYNQTDACLKEYSFLKPKSFAMMLKNGPPMRYRWSVWKNFLEPEQFFVEDLYEKLKNLTSSYEIDIRKDVHRTFPNEPYFSSERFNNIGQDQLFNVLKALSLYLPNVGYTHGMNFIAAFLLLVSGGNELEAFWAFVALARGNRFLIMGFFEKDFPLLKFYIFLFYEVLESEMPKLYDHLKQQQIPDELWLMKWFMSFFLYSLPPQQVIRIWDFVMAEGMLGIIKVSLGLLKVVEKDILLLDSIGIDLLFQYLKNEGNRITNISHGNNTNSQNISNPNQSHINHIQSRVIAQNVSNQSHLHTNQSHVHNLSMNNLQIPSQNILNNMNLTQRDNINNQSVNNPQILSQNVLNNMNLTQRDNLGIIPSVHNETSEIQYSIKELDVNEVLGHAENVILTFDKLLYFIDLYPEKMGTKLPEPYGQFFKNLHLYQTDMNKLIEFQKEIDFHFLKSELSDKPNEEIVICNLLDENTLILKDLIL